MIICITGTPGTGKTTLGKKLAKALNYIYIDANVIIEKYKLKEKYDILMDSCIVDVKKLEIATFKEIKNFKKNNTPKTIKKRKENFIIDSHMSHHFSNKNIDLCIVCTCELKELKNRLKKRKYKTDKVNNNLNVEIFETCFIEANENNHNVLKTTNNSNIDNLIKHILEI